MTPITHLTLLIRAAARVGHTTRRAVASADRRALARDARGMTEVLGGIMMFGVLFAGLVIVQATAVPTWNAQIEYDHSLRADADMQSLGSGISTAAITGTAPAITFEQSVAYPNRPFLFNVPTTSGSVETTDPVGVSISNAQIDGVDTVWGGAGVDPAPFENQFVRFTPSYNYFDDAPVYGYEYGISYREHVNESGASTYFTANKGAVVDGKQLTLVFLTGDVSLDSYSEASMDLYPVSAPANPVTISNVAGQDLTLTLPTMLDEQTWLDLLADQYDPTGTIADAYVSDIQFNDGATINTLTLTFEPGTYTLRMAKVSLGEPADEPAHYVKMVSDMGASIRTSETRDVTVQVRDRFNNPVAGAPVTFSLDTGNSLFVTDSGVVLGSGDRTVVSDATGRATVHVRVLDNFVITVGGDLDGDGNVEAHEQVTRQQVIETSGVSDGINPYNPDHGLVLTDAKEISDSTFELTFTNTGATNQTIQEGRLSFYYRASPGGNGEVPPAVAVLEDGAGNKDTDMLIRGIFKEIPNDGITIPGNSEGKVLLTFYTDAAKTTPYVKQNADDWFIFATITNGQSATYFVFPGKSLVEQVRPIADAGGPYTTEEGLNLLLDGTNSVDNDGTIDVWQWTITSDPTGLATLLNADTSTPTLVVPPDVSGDANIKLKLTVYDNDGRSDIDTATISVLDMDIRNPPVVTMSVTDLSFRSNGAHDYAKFVVVWTATDIDADLYTVKIDLIDTQDGNSVEDTTGTMFISGASASGTVTLNDNHAERDYKIQVTVTDSMGHVVEKWEIHFADGDEIPGNIGGSPYP